MPIQLLLTGAQAAVLAGPTSAGRGTHRSFLLLVFPFSLFSDQLAQQYSLAGSRKPIFLVTAYSSCHLPAPRWLLGLDDTSAEANSISGRCSGEAFSSAGGFRNWEQRGGSGHSPSPVLATMRRSGPSRGLDAGGLLRQKGLLSFAPGLVGIPPVGIHSRFGRPYGKGVLSP